jgi:3-hydroxyacyl-[acyl-carrier-protein] dehydratase
VALQPLFDLSHIDLDAVAVSREEVGRINPQSGDMRQLGHVIWHKPDCTEILGVKEVRRDEFWVPGHIPGRPLLPGVLQIEAAAQLASVSFRIRTSESRFLAFTRLTDVAFRTQVVPGDLLYLLAQEVDFRPRRFVCRAQGIVNMTAVAFEATITGMVIRDGEDA